MFRSVAGTTGETMSESQEVTPEDADTIVKMEKSVTNPAVSTEEVAEELGVSTEEAFKLLDESPRPSGKPVGNTHIWW